MLDAPDAAARRVFARLYGEDDALLRGKMQFFRDTAAAFGEAYGLDTEVILARSTGRVNLMGRHSDFAGGWVNPIAVNEMALVAQRRDDDVVELRDVAQDRFSHERFVIREGLPHGKIHDWEDWTLSEFEKRKAAGQKLTWSNYVKAAVLYLQHLNTNERGEFAPALRGMNVMLDSTVAIAVGQSSSSALVMAALEACARVNDLRLTDMQMVEAGGYAEWYVGTRGGCGDHAAIKFGRLGSVSHLGSYPLSVDHAPLPKGYAVVVANSLVEAKKQAGARDFFNQRVASYRIGLLMLRRFFPQHAGKLGHLRDVNPAALGITERQVYEKLRRLPESATRAEILEALPDDREALEHLFRNHAEPKDGYRIRQICAYGVAETARSRMAAEKLHAGDVKGFGELINISHEGDRVTRLEGGRRVRVDNSLSDARLDALVHNVCSHNPALVESARVWRLPGGYDASCEEIDILVDAARSVPGVAGAGLVGAGLGGTMIALVREDQAPQVTERMVEAYYHPRNLPVAVEVVQPTGGCGVLDVE
jgi:N-acetylgalactosamine kinase